MIGNIFYPGAPLHDGAAVFRDGRICAAGCILPLTPNHDISSELGTRHRASIGMSEQSDAVIVVVSEETGAISVAYKGRLRRGISDVTFERYLWSILLSRKRTKEIRKSRNG